MVQRDRIEQMRPATAWLPPFQAGGAFLMTLFRSFLIAAAAALALAACSFSPSAPNTSVPPSPPSLSLDPSITSEHYREDADSCYAYARGEIAHDARIESDVGAAFQSEAGGLGLAALRGRMSNFERTRRVPSLFNRCMAAKGYGRR